MNKLELKDIVMMKTNNEAKLKAIELQDKYFRDELLHWDLSYIQAKQCALIAVDEIIKCTNHGLGLTPYSKEFWQEVKKEIIKL